MFMRKAFKILAVTTLALTLALPFTAYAGTWQQDSTGWKVQVDDGTYLTNQWYQSPESGLFYYIGADGYMMVNTITPDGYQVGADGAWIQPQPAQQPTQSETQPQVQETESNNGPIMSLEEEAKMWEEAGLGGAPKGEVVTNVGGDADAGQGYDWGN